MDKTLKIIRSIIFVIAAVFCFTIGGNITNNELGSCPNDEAYGGDAYTGIQQASAQTARNIFQLSRYLQDVAQYTFIIAGIICLACAVPVGIGRSKKEE